MRPPSRLREAALWFVMPLVAVVLARSYYEFFLQFSAILGSPSDPRWWDWDDWLVQAGPLTGFGFLAGATAGLPEPSGRRWRRWLGARWLCVAVGPWAGFLAWAVIGYVSAGLDWVWNRWTGTHLSLPTLEWPQWVVQILVYVISFSTLCLAWVWIAWPVLVRARRLGLFWRSFERGVVVAVSFLGSLFGGFWVATELFRSYFFDKRLVPLVGLAVMAVGLILMSGCASTQTVGDVRRKELFDAMFVAWVIGLALLWRWRSRAGKQA